MILIPRPNEYWQRKPNNKPRLLESHWAYDRLTAAFPLCTQDGFTDLVDSVVLAPQAGANIADSSDGRLVAKNGSVGDFFTASSYKPYEPTNFITFIIGVTRTGGAESFGKVVQYGPERTPAWGSYEIEQFGTTAGSIRAGIAVNGTRILTPTVGSVLNVDETTQLSCRYDGAKLDLYKKGVVISTVSGSGTIGDYGTEGLSIGSRYDGDQHYPLETDYLWMFHGSALDDDEIYSLYEAPYQFLTKRKTYFPLSGAEYISINIGIAFESNIAQSLTKKKDYSLSIVSELNQSLSVSSAYNIPVGQTAESNTAQPITTNKAIILGITAETNEALAVSYSVEIAVDIGVATEINTAQSIIIPINVLINSALETDTAQLITRLKELQLGIALESDLSQSISASFAKIIGIVSESDTAQGVTAFSPTAIGQVLENNIALSVVTPKEVDLGIAIESDTALSILLALIAFYEGDTKIFTEIERGYNFTEPTRGDIFEEKL